MLRPRLYALPVKQLGQIVEVAGYTITLEVVFARHVPAGVPWLTTITYTAHELLEAIHNIAIIPLGYDEAVQWRNTVQATMKNEPFQSERMAWIDRAIPPTFDEWLKRERDDKIPPGP